MQNAKNTVCIWYDTEAEEAANFYAATFPDTHVTAVHRAPSDNPSTRAGAVLTVAWSFAVDVRWLLQQRTQPLARP